MRGRGRKFATSAVGVESVSSAAIATRCGVGKRKCATPIGNVFGMANARRGAKAIHHAANKGKLPTTLLYARC